MTDAARLDAILARLGDMETGNYQDRTLAVQGIA